MGEYVRSKTRSRTIALAVLILGLAYNSPNVFAGQSVPGKDNFSLGVISNLSDDLQDDQLKEAQTTINANTRRLQYPGESPSTGETTSNREILYSNGYYCILTDSTNLLSITNATGDPVISGFNYRASYGVEGNNNGPVLSAGATSINVYPDEVAQFSTGEAQIHSGAYNNSLMGEVVITGISGNTIYFTPPLSEPLEEAYTPNRRILQIKQQFNVLNDVIISTESNFNGRTSLIINGTTTVASVEIKLICNNSSPEINIEVNTSYSEPVSIFYERIELISAQPVSEIYEKNRQRGQPVVGSDYWLDRQGVKFGSESACATIYHTPKVSSLELATSTNTLRVNLDHMDDHHYRWLADTGTLAENRRYLDKNCSVYNVGDHRINSFAVTVGLDVEVPRLMLNPDGYLATYVFTEHADGGTLATQRAMAYGSSEITSSSASTGGFAYYGIPMTKSVFYSWKSGDSNVALTGHSDSAAFRNLCTDLSQNLGFEICPHTPSYYSNSPAEVNSMLTNMASQYSVKTWIDHSADFNREDFSADGLDPLSTYFCKDIWEAHGVSYFWQYASEDNRILWETGAGDILRGVGDPNARTPLWWRHPTVTADFVTWASDFMASATTYDAADWKQKLSAANLADLVNNWGVVINHGYWVNAARYSSFMVRTGTAPNYIYQISNDFNAALAVLKSFKDAGNINVATVKQMLDYWLALDKVDLAFVDESTFIVTNNSSLNIEGLALAIPTPTLLKVDGLEPEQRIVGEDTVFWFNLAGGASSTVTMAEGPEIIVEPVILNFGAVPVNSSTVLQFTIHNTGDATLSGSITTPGGFSVSRAVRTSRPDGLIALSATVERNTVNFTIGAESSQTYDLTFTPTETADYTGYLVVSSNDAANPTVNVALTGSGYYANLYGSFKAFLQGPYQTGGSMAHDLESLLPLSSPYNEDHNVLALPDVSPHYVVDWVYLQLRASPNGPIEQSRSAFMLENGSLVDLSGNPAIAFEYRSETSFYVILSHRNHLGIMTASSHSLAISPDEAPLIDLTVLNSVYGGNQTGVKQVEPGVLALVAGDADQDGSVLPTDFNLYWRPQSGLMGYLSADFDLNGAVLPTDLNLYWRLNVGLLAQIPE